MSQTISNTDQIIDSRAVIERFAELESELEVAYDNFVESKAETEQEDYEEYVAEHEEAASEEPALTFADWKTTFGSDAPILDFQDWLTSDNTEEIEEYKALQDLIEDAEGCGDWQYGETLIHEDYFREYAEQLAEDIGAVDRNASWPLRHIDWEAAADELKQDYSEVTFGGERYYIRS